MQVHCFTCREDLAVVGDLGSHAEHHVEVMSETAKTKFDCPETYFGIVLIFGLLIIVAIVAYWISRWG